MLVVLFLVVIIDICYKCSVRHHIRRHESKENLWTHGKCINFKWIIQGRTGAGRDWKANSNLIFEAVWCYGSYLSSKLRLKELSQSVKYIAKREKN